MDVLANPEYSGSRTIRVNAGNRVRLFQDNIPKCLKLTILPLIKK